MQVYRSLSFGIKFADLFVLLTYDHNIMLISNTKSIATSSGIGYWQYFCLRILVLLLPILFAASINIGIAVQTNNYSVM